MKIVSTYIEPDFVKQYVTRITGVCIQISTTLFCYFSVMNSQIFNLTAHMRDDKVG